MGFLSPQSGVCDLRESVHVLHPKRLFLLLYFIYHLRCECIPASVFSYRTNSKWKFAEEKMGLVTFDRIGNWRVRVISSIAIFLYLYFSRSCTRKVHPSAANSCQISIQHWLSKGSTRCSPTLEMHLVFINILFIYMRVISTRSHKRSWIN